MKSALGHELQMQELVNLCVFPGCYGNGLAAKVLNSHSLRELLTRGRDWRNQKADH